MKNILGVSGTLNCNNKLENWNNKLECVVSNLLLLSVDCPLEIEELNQVAQIHDPDKEDAVDYNLFITCKKFINKVDRKYPLSSQTLSNPSLNSFKCHTVIRKKIAACPSVSATKEGLFTVYFTCIYT